MQDYFHQVDQNGTTIPQQQPNKTSISGVNIKAIKKVRKTSYICGAMAGKGLIHILAKMFLRNQNA